MCNSWQLVSCGARGRCRAHELPRCLTHHSSYVTAARLYSPRVRGPAQHDTLVRACTSHACARPPSRAVLASSPMQVLPSPTSGSVTPPLPLIYLYGSVLSTESSLVVEVSMPGAWRPSCPGAYWGPDAVQVCVR